MPTLRLALAQVNPTVGDLAGNSELIRRWSRVAAEGGADLALFPEMVLTGYPPEDLVLRRSFVRASLAALEQLAGKLAADGLGELPILVGYLDRCPRPVAHLGRPAGEPQNCAALIHGGKVVARYAKHHLPNYGVFDEFRYFVSGDELPVLRLGGVDVAPVICEDLWQDGGPVTAAGAAGAGLLAWINGSPYECHKEDFREELARRRGAEAGAAVACVNLVGGQDELVFDGGSFVIDADGRLLARAAQFEETCLFADLEVAERATGGADGQVDVADGTSMRVQRVVLSEAPVRNQPAISAEIAPRLSEEEEVYRALVTGTRDYVRKNGFSSVVLGLSGGIDSAVTATIAADALGADAVHVVGMPGPYSSEGSVSDAEDLAGRQRLHWQVIPIAPVVEGFAQSLAPSGGLHGLAAENLQARIRGTLLMALSNEAGHLVLTTGNKSELATGFSTLYGDSAGGFAPLKDVPKTMVWRLARWRNEDARDRRAVEPIPESSISKAPSAELAPGQLDADRLPDYQVLDALLEQYVGYDRGRSELLEAGFGADLVERVIRLVDAAEYKRRQYPPGPKISLKAFGRDRRLPISNRWREPAE